MIKGTAAIRIFVGIFIIYITWLIVKAMKMELIGSIMGQVIGVGMIALIVVFQQEIRQFLLLLGNKYIKSSKSFSFRSIKLESGFTTENIAIIADSAIEMAQTRTGALIVISKDRSLRSIEESGEIINCDINKQMIKSIFYKDAPLHDGAILITENKILAAKCILPLSSTTNLDKDYGLRHRSGLGLTEVSDSIVIIVSEQTGKIAIAQQGKIYKITELNRLSKIITSFLRKGEQVES